MFRRKKSQSNGERPAGSRRRKWFCGLLVACAVGRPGRRREHRYKTIWPGGTPHQETPTGDPFRTNCDWQSRSLFCGPRHRISTGPVASRLQ